MLGDVTRGTEGGYGEQTEESEGSREGGGEPERERERECNRVEQVTKTECGYQSCGAWFIVASTVLS